MQRIIMLAAMLLAMFPALRASQLNTTNYFLVTFQMTDLGCPYGSCDTLFFSPSFTAANTSAVTAQLLNGTQVLATYSSSNPAFCCTAGFESATSAFGIYGVLADFTTLQNGTIQGQFIYSVAGTLDGFNPAESFFAVGHASGPGGIATYDGSIQILSEQILNVPTPEPATLLLGTSALLLMGFLFTRQRNSGRT
jgi:hypothetical protein